MKKIFSALAILLVLFFMFCLIRRTIQNSGNYLVLRQRLSPCDCIIVLAGERGERVREGIKLFEAGWGKYLIMSGGLGEAGIPLSSLMKAQAVKAGVPERFILEENRSEDTGEDAYYTRLLMERHNLKSAVLVTSPYHSRRSMFIFEKIFKNSGIKLISYPVTDSWYNPHQWWKTKRGMKANFSEYNKLLWYHLFPQSFKIEN